MKRSKVIALLALVAVCGGLFAVAILKNYLGLRTRLYIDTKIHVVTHPQQDQVLQRDLGGDTTQVLVAGRVGRRSKSVEVGGQSNAYGDCTASARILDDNVATPACFPRPAPTPI